MKKLNLIKGVLVVALGLCCTIAINAQAPATEGSEGSEGANLIESSTASNNLNGDVLGVIATLEGLSKAGNSNLNGIIASLQNLSASVNSQTGVLNFQNLSSNRSTSVEGVNRSTSVEGINRSSSVEGVNRSSSVEGVNGIEGKITVQALSSQEVVSQLDGIISSLE